METETVRELDAEIAVAGAILVDSKCYKEIARLIDEDSFRYNTCKTVFAAAKALYEKGAEIDPVAISEWAKEQGTPLDDKVLISYMELTPTAANAGLYAELVKKHARRRELRDCLTEALENETSDVDELLAETSRRLEKLQNAPSGAGCISSGTAAASFYSSLTEREKGKRNVVPTGYASLDRVLGGGFLNSGLYILAARPGMGKTTFALNLADSIEGNVLYVSLEMSTEQITAKRLARLSGIPANRLLMGENFTKDEWQRVAEASAKLGRTGLFANEYTGITVSGIERLAKSVKGLTAVVIDYLGLIKPQTSGSRYEQVTEISGDLKKLAMSLNVPVIALAQLNRSSETRQGKRPSLSDLRDSGAIEQDADAVLLLSRSDYYTREKRQPWTPSLIDCDIAKNRHSSTGAVQLNGYLDVCRVVEV